MATRTSWLSLVAGYVLLSGAAVIVASGCSGKPARIPAPDFSANGAASGAMSLYDKNGDGALDATELIAVPCLLPANSNVDANKDGRVDSQEIAKAVDGWIASRTGIMATPVTVTMNGAPLVGATVTFEPEPFLNGVISASLGETDDRGSTSISLPESVRPDPRIAAAHPGWYKVRISKLVNGAESIPAKYNSATTLGAEISSISPASQQGHSFKLSTKEK